VKRRASAASLMDDAPHFRFYPNAYAAGGYLGRSDKACDLCHRPCGWRFKGCIYAIEKLETICARCIVSGALANHCGDEHFSLHDGEMEDADPTLAQEVLQRTPGIASFNPFTWPTLDRKPLAFVGHGDAPETVAIPEARAAIAAAFAEIDWEPAEESPYALVFREIDGPRYRAVIDLD
jgi:uncharacterized protein